MAFLQILILISGISFVYYGISSFFSKKMKVEYNRWGYPEQRLIIGSLQLLGGLGLFLGFVFRTVIFLPFTCWIILAGILLFSKNGWPI